MVDCKNYLNFFILFSQSLLKFKNIDQWRANKKDWLLNSKLKILSGKDIREIDIFLQNNEIIKLFIYYMMIHSISNIF